MRKENKFWSFFNCPLTFWIAFSCPLHGGCLLSLLEPISRELDSFPTWLKLDAIKTYKWRLFMVFSFRLKVHTSLVIIYLPLLSFLLLHSPTLSCWWRTCWSGSCTLLRIFEAQDLIYDVSTFTIISICFVSWNIRNPCMKSLRSHALEWLVFMCLDSILERVVYQICMRYFIKYWWLLESINYL